MMTWPFENDTGAIVKKLAERSLAGEKRRDLMVVIAVALAAFLISFAAILSVSVAQIQRNQVADTYEAVFTVNVPFPLYQACSYQVRFQDPETPGNSYVFTFHRWDEAFADMIPWEGDHDSLLFVDTGRPDGSVSVQQDSGGDDRIGGSLVRRVTFSPDSDFTFDMLGDFSLSCSVATSV